MPLDRNAFEAALATALRSNFQRGKDEEWDSARAADELAKAIADAVHNYMSAARVGGVTSTVRNSGGTVIGTGNQTGEVALS